MRRRRYVSPDGVDWRDEEMLVYRRGKRDGKRVEGYFDRREVEAAARRAVEDWTLVGWRDDPTYGMRRRKGDG